MCPITITIGSERRDLDEADPSWIATQINRRRAEGVTVCVRVEVLTGDLNLALTQPGCSSGGGVGRPPNRREQQIFDLWNEMGLNTAGFAGGQVIAFVKRVCMLIGIHVPPGLRYAA